MYERTGRYYALFGPKAVTTDAEERFLRHWARGRERALDLGAGLCGPATMLARLGLDVLAFEPSPILGALALDRLGRVSDEGGNVTLVEGDTATFAEPFTADLLLMRSVWMLLDDAQRKLAIEALKRHCAPGARLIVDARTAALFWADKGGSDEERRIGHTLFRRSNRYARLADGSTQVHWIVEVERFCRRVDRVEESFTVRADSADDLSRDLSAEGFAIEQLYAAYDLDAPYAAGSEMIFAVASG
ncbi:MAG: class I SAM-dependent methyltransferase [Steroidobacteraceae bacterium]